MELETQSLSAISAAIRDRRLTSEAVTGAVLDRIARLEPRLRAHAMIFADQALAAARIADAEIERGLWRGPLHGVPFGVKDLLYLQGAPTASGTLVMRDFDPGYDATVVARLRRAGAVLVGKHQLSEGATMQHHPAIDPPLNPWSAAHWTGISSSGSGVAVAAGLAYGSLGTDTGGSIRFPSAACGVTGVKPSWGRVSRHGLFHLAETFDHIGPIARSAEDCAHILRVIAGADRNDPTAAPAPVPDYTAAAREGIGGLRIGIDPRYTRDGVDQETLACFDAAIEALVGAGAEVREIALPDVAAALAQAMAITIVEIGTTHRDTFPSRADEYGPALRAGLEAAAHVSGVDVGAAIIARRKFAAALAHVFTGVDLIATPALPCATPSLARMDEFYADPMPFTWDVGRFAMPFNLTGHPTISLPAGFGGEGMPIGIQLVARPFEEAALFRAGAAFQAMTDWHTRRPPL